MAYRHQGGYAHDEALAVLVQAMVQADVWGVMFTANPMTADTTEIVVNASCGLGEAIVSGVTNPDQIRLRKSDLEVIERIKGSKEVEIVADPDNPSGTVQRRVSDERRDGWALSDEQLRNAAPASLYSDAPVTCQFMLEDHAVRHSYHHLLRIRTLLHV